MANTGCGARDMSHDIRILTETDLRRAVALNLATVDVVERAFAELADGKVVMPPILSMDLADVNGEVDVKTAYIPGFDGFAIKVSPGFFNNPSLGLPSLNGLMVLFSSKTGLVEALFLDNGYLTDIRTAAAGAVAARHLAPEVICAGVMGTGVQARLQVEAAHLVRPFQRVEVWGRDPEKAETCAADIAARLGIPARAENDPEALVAHSQLVVTTTPSRVPILHAEWLHPGLHITAVGSDQAGKSEIASGALAAADLCVCDRISQCEVAGELQAARAADVDVRPVELGDIVAGAVTICDLTGTGAQDTAIANHAMRLTVGIGARIQT